MKLIENRNLGYFRIHLSQIGGITPSRAVQQFAAGYGVRAAWHGPGCMSPIAHAANMHVDLAAGNSGIREWSAIEPPDFMIEKLNGVKGALLDVFPGMPEQGNDSPGPGMDFNEKEASKYPCRSDVTTWTQTRNADGSLQSP